MVGGIPVHYRGGGENVVATYDYTDIAEGTGVVVFYGTNNNDSVGAGYYLSTTATPSTYIGVWAGTTGTEYTKAGDYDFDLSAFNLPKRIKGTARFIFTQIGKGGTNDAISQYLTFKIRKYSGTTETEIANVTSQTVTLGSSSGVVGSIMGQVAVSIPTIQNFMKGDILRITVEVYAKLLTSGGTGYAGIACDPKDRDDAAFKEDADSSIFEAHIPFVLDL